MSQREIRAFDYVNQPYEPVRDMLKREAQNIFQRATKLAEDRSGDLLAALSVDLAGIRVTRDIKIVVGQIREEKLGRTDLSRITHVPLEWQAAASPGLFPALTAELSVFPLSFGETQVELRGHYDPPMGILGSALDAVVGHRLAEASVHRFIHSVVERLRRELASGK
jgi:hypothetical protein